MKLLTLILLLLPATLYASTALYDDAAQVVTNKTIDCALNTCTNYEGSAVKSTGEANATKFLREDGDGTSSWQTVPAGGSSSTYISLSVQGEPELTANNAAIMWVSNGTGIGASGQLMILTNISGVVRYASLKDWIVGVATLPTYRASTNYWQFAEGDIMQWAEGGNAEWAE